MSYADDPLDVLTGRYKHINLLPAIGGVLFTVAAAVQFLGASFSISTPSWSFPTGAEALMISLVVLLIAYATSDTRSWDHYDTWEKVTVGGAVILMLAEHYVSWVATEMANFDPFASWAAVILGVGAFYVVGR